MKLIYCAVGIMMFNLTWSYFQERVGTRDYCGSDGKCERFHAIPIMNLVQAFFAALVARTIMLIRGMSVDTMPVPFSAFLPPSATHTVASPLGYGAMRFLPYPLYILVSSCKLIPVMVVGFFVNGIVPTSVDLMSAFAMTSGIVMYSFDKIFGPESTAKSGSAASGASIFGYELTAAQTILVGITFTCTNLILEGFTNAGQDKLFGKKKTAIPAAAVATEEEKEDSSKNKKKKQVVTSEIAVPITKKERVPSLWMQAAMNSWTVTLLSIGMMTEHILLASINNGENAASSHFSYFASFVSRHPSLLQDIVTFAVLGSFAQIFIFTCIEHFGSFTTTTITISRKFVTVLLSVIIFGHHLKVIQWCGVALVFFGLALQLTQGQILSWWRIPFEYLSGGKSLEGAEAADAKKSKKEQ